MPEQRDLESRMRALEAFSEQRILPSTWVIIRVDGRAFSRYTEDRYAKPFDSCFRDYMVAAAQAIVQDLEGIFAYTESDEISVLFPPSWELFDRRLEKVVSVAASLAASTFTRASGDSVSFDGRSWSGVAATDVLDYFRWRQGDAYRCALNSWCYWKLREEGRSPSAAHEELHSKSVSFKNELLFQRGINFNEVPAWQRRGTALFREEYEKEGFNPISQQVVVATRRRLVVDHELPVKVEFERLLASILQPYS